MRFFVHRDTTTGVVSLVSVADGSDTMGCSGAYEASFTASSGVTLVHSDEQDDVTLVGGVGMVSHAWNNGCGDGFILQLPNSGASVDGAITSRTNLQQLQVVADAAGGVLVDVPLASLPNNGAPGTPVPFYFASGLTGSLESSVFALGEPRAGSLASRSMPRWATPRSPSTCAPGRAKSTRAPPPGPARSRAALCSLACRPARSSSTAWT
jgi:hypothetical protein